MEAKMAELIPSAVGGMQNGFLTAAVILAGMVSAALLAHYLFVKVPKNMWANRRR
jgi:hypothetical protein